MWWSMAESLKFAPSILARLGEELVPHPDQGIIELVKNAYDADARTCQVELVNVTERGGTVVVTDDGDGMASDQIRDGWLVLGRSGKDPTEVTRLGRLPVGEKGLGRLAALRLGRTVVLETRPRVEPGIEYVLAIDWSLFDKAEVVEDVELEIVQRSTTLTSGTTIRIHDLEAVFGRMDTKRLARSLLLLADPFEFDRSFRAELITPEFQDLEERVRNAYFDEADYHLKATLDKEGRGSAQVLDHRGNLLWEASHEELRQDGTYAAPSATFELWEFTLRASAFSSKSATIEEVRAWLGEVGGVHLYHRGLRVRPYGDPGHDWLEMNLRRARSPEERPSTNNSIGVVTVDDSRDLLSEKTDRSGFIENQAFSDLREFAVDSLDWMARQRVRERDRRRRDEREKRPRQVTTAKKGVDEAVEKVPAKHRRSLEDAIKRLDRAREREREAILSDLQLYRTLSTVGTTASVFAHEAASPLNRIDRLTSAIERRAKKALGDAYSDELGSQVGLLRRAAQALRSFVNLPLSLLQREKRRMRVIDVHAALDEVLELFSPFLADADITVKTEYIDQAPRVRGRVASLEAILANLLTNSIAAFQRADSVKSAREIHVGTVVSGDRLLLSVRDNGPGIRDISIDDIWLPGQTTKPGGTGIGLTIVRDEASDLGGRAYVTRDSTSEGAEFVVDLPLHGVT